MEELIELAIAEQKELCAQVRDYRKRSLNERIALAQAYRHRQLQRWNNHWYPFLCANVMMHGRTVKVRFGSSYSLIDASSRDDVEEVRALLEAGANPNAVNFDGLSALHQCCIEDSQEIAEALIQHGADVNLRDNEWWTPLHAAASCGHEHLVKLLLESGASVASLNCDGDLPIDMAETSEIFDILKQAQNDQDITDEDLARQRYQVEEQILEDLESGKLDVDARDHVGATALHVAAAHGFVSVAEALLQRGADSNARDQDDWTPVHAAACWGYADILDVLGKYGADFDARTKSYDTPYSLTEDEELRTIIMELKMQTQKLSLRRRSGKRLTISSRGYSIKRSTLQRKKSLSRDDAKKEAEEYRAAAEQLAQELDAVSGSRDDLDRIPAKQSSPTSPTDSQSSSVFGGADQISPSSEIAHTLAGDSLVPSTGVDVPQVNEDDIEIASMSVTDTSNDGTVKPKLIFDDGQSTSTFDLPTENGHSCQSEHTTDVTDSRAQPYGKTDDLESPQSVTHTSTSGLLKEDKLKARTDGGKCCLIL